MALVDEIIKPSDCFFGMCLPVTKEDYISSLEPGNNKSFSKIRQAVLRYNPQALWEDDHLPLVNLFLGKKKELEKLGVTVCLNFSMKDVKKIGDFKVAILFAHHDDEENKIEFFDGMYDVKTIIENFPEEYDKILDLTVCCSISLQTAIKNKFKKCLVVANKLQTNPEFRLLCCAKAISLLHTENISYVDAIAKVRIALINSMPKKK